MGKKGWLFIILLLAITMPVCGTESGSITLNMKYQTNPVPGGTVTVYDVTELNFCIDDENDLDEILSMGLSGVTKEIDADGRAEFEGLGVGRYLLVQNTAATGFEPMNPFCVSIPMKVGNEYQYHIEAYPKLDRSSEEELPQTGQNRLPVWGLLCSGFASVLLGALLQKRK